MFPGLQGGPHNNAIAAIAVALEQAKTKEFRQYAEQIIKNAQAMANRFQKHGYKVVTGTLVLGGPKGGESFFKEEPKNLTTDFPRFNAETSDFCSFLDLFFVFLLKFRRFF